MDPCIEWQGFVAPNGYGRYGRTSAHRAAYVKAHGPIPSGMEVMHLCHNRRCVNPEHLTGKQEFRKAA